jgi:hypothetical protein
MVEVRYHTATIGDKTVQGKPHYVRSLTQCDQSPEKTRSNPEQIEGVRLHACRIRPRLRRANDWPIELRRFPCTSRLARNAMREDVATSRYHLCSCWRNTLQKLRNQHAKPAGKGVVESLNAVHLDACSVNQPADDFARFVLDVSTARLFDVIHKHFPFLLHSVRNLHFGRQTSTMQPEK